MATGTPPITPCGRAGEGESRAEGGVHLHRREGVSGAEGGDNSHRRVVSAGAAREPRKRPRRRREY
eukprot:6038065-Pyramimonas_sp.AAC.1